MAKILIVEDDAAVRYGLHIALERAGHEVQDTCNGEEAIEAYSQHPADVILTDLLMPRKEGMETLIEFRRKHPSAKVIAMSGGGWIDANTYLQAARNLGAACCLSKPFSVDELLAAVQQVLTTGNHRAEIGFRREDSAWGDDSRP